MIVSRENIVHVHKSRARAMLAVLALLLSTSLTSAVGAPLEELTRAVLRGGASTVKDASSRQFLSAYMSILARVKPNEIIWYVNAAVKIRPDLAEKIVLATLNVRRPNAKISDRTACQFIGDIVQAAIMANPEQAIAIVKAALEAAPSARGCVVGAAIAVAPDQRIAVIDAASEGQAATQDGLAMLNSAFIPAIGTINPADYTAPANVISPERPPSSP
jgi:hypothetical protein